MCQLFNRINAFCSIDAFLFLNKKHLAELSPAYVSALLDLVTWLKYQAVQQASVDESVTQLSMLFLCFKYEGLKVLWILLLQTFMWPSELLWFGWEGWRLVLQLPPSKWKRKYSWSLPNLPSSCTQLSHWHCDMNWCKSLLATLIEL